MKQNRLNPLIYLYYPEETNCVKEIFGIYISGSKYFEKNSPPTISRMSLNMIEEFQNKYI